MHFIRNDYIIDITGKARKAKRARRKRKRKFKKDIKIFEEENKERINKKFTKKNI